MEASGKRNWSGIAVPALVLVLLLVQFALGFRGFDQPHDGVLGLLEAPGALLGWGGVVVLAILLAWLVAGWAGRDLFGLQGPAGLVFRLVGCVAFGVAVSGLLGLAGEATLGGSVGAWLGGLLEGNLGSVVGVILLVLMAIPSFVLAISPFFLSGPLRTRDGGVPRERLADLEPKPGLYEGTAPQTKPLYPERRYDENGNEIPIRFDTRDVGSIRFAPVEGEDDEGGGSAADAEAEAAADEVESREDEAASEDETESLPAGVRYADEAVESDADDGAEDEDVDDGRLLEGVRYADDESTTEEVEEDVADDVEEEEDEEDDEVVEVEDDESLEDEVVEDKDEDVEDEEEEDVVEDESVEDEVDLPAPHPSRSSTLEELENDETGAHYRAKLEGSGIFDEPPALEPPAAKPKMSTATRKKATATRKKATPTKKKAVARKKKATATKKKAVATKKKATPTKKKAVAKKKATTTKKKAVAKKKATPTKKKAAARKKATPTKKKAAPKTGKATPTKAKATPARRKGARTPPDETYRKAVEVAMERGAASSVLLSRRLGLGYARARALIETLVEDGVLGEMTPSGSRPLLITPSEWKKRT